MNADDVLAAMFAAEREGIDSLPFAHQSALDSAITSMVPATPGQGAGCPLVLLAAVGVLAVLVAVAWFLLAVTP